MADFDEHFLENMSRQMDDITIRQRERKAAWVAQHGPRNKWMRDHAVEVFTQADEECWIHRSPMWDEFERMKNDPIIKSLPQSVFLDAGYNGYVCFREKPVIEPDTRGIIAYIPVHGGITYCEHDEYGSAYGFDTGHFNSSQFPIRETEWIKKQILMMILGIREAAKIEPEYLKADGDNQRRAELVQPLVDLADELNVGIMINLLGGQL